MTFHANRDNVKTCFLEKKVKKKKKKKKQEKKNSMSSAENFTLSAER